MTPARLLALLLVAIFLLVVLRSRRHVWTGSRSGLARQVGAAIRERGLTPGQAGAALGLDQPGVAALLDGRLMDFSMERLVGFLLALDRDIEMAVRPKQAARAHVRVA
jgi:predicted XRE-type DNA-binding protein